MCFFDFGTEPLNLERKVCFYEKDFSFAFDGIYDSRRIYRVLSKTSIRLVVC